MPSGNSFYGGKINLTLLFNPMILYFIGFAISSILESNPHVVQMASTALFYLTLPLSNRASLGLVAVV